MLKLIAGISIGGGISVASYHLALVSNNVTPLNNLILSASGGFFLFGLLILLAIWISDRQTSKDDLAETGFGGTDPD